jgi:hypothetical protein
MALGINFSGRTNMAPVTIELGDVTVGGEFITAQGIPVCVRYLDPDGNTQFDSVLLVTALDPDNVTAQPTPVGLFELQSGNVLAPYNLPGGITEVEWSFGDCAAFLAEILTQISLDLSQVVSVLTDINNNLENVVSVLTDINNNLENVVSILTDIEVLLDNIVTVLAEINNNLENIVDVITDISNNVTNTHIVHYCDVIENEGETTTQRFFTIYVISQTGEVVSQSNWINESGTLSPYTPQGEIKNENCCPPDDCPPIIGTELLCLEVINPCSEDSFIISFAGDPDNGYIAGVLPVPGFNTPFTVEWESTGDIETALVTNTNPISVIFGGPGTLTAVITVQAEGGDCEVTKTVTFVCDGTVGFDVDTENYFFGSNIFIETRNIGAEVVSLEIGGIVYTAADYATATGNPIPTTDDPINLLDFLGWVANQHPTGTEFSLLSMDSEAEANRINILSCGNEDATLILDDGLTPQTINSNPDGYFTSSSNLTCGGVICLSANPVSGISITEDTANLIFLPGNVQYEWVLSEGLTLVNGELDTPTICVAGCGTVGVTIFPTVCEPISGTIQICSPCSGGTIEIEKLLGAQVCAGIEITDIDINQTTRLITFSFTAADTNTGVGVQSAGYYQPLPGNILQPFTHPLDPDHASNITGLGNSGTISLHYPHFALLSTAPIQNGGSFIGMGFGTIPPGGYSISETPLSPISWNAGTDPTGSAFRTAVQNWLNTIQGTYNIELRAGVYVQGTSLNLVVRVYPAIDTLPSVQLAKMIYQPAIGSPFIEITNSVLQNGVPFIRVLNTDCGVLAAGVRVSQLNTWWLAIPPNVNTFVDTFKPLPSWGIYATYPECCATQTTLTAVLTGATPLSYQWFFGAGVTLAAGSITSPTVQVEGSGNATVIISTAECGNIVKTTTV